MSNEFITTDSGLIYEEIITQLESFVSEPLYPGDERRIFGEALVPLFVGMYNAVNDAAQQKTLRYARGEVLDALGERAGVERLAARGASTVLRFSLASPIAENVIIPEGTRATSDGVRYFATSKAAVIEEGGLYIDVDAVSVGVGSEYNDIAIGAVNVIVDLIPYVDSVSNLTATAGGDDEESDDNLRERIRLAPSKMSTAGSVQGYRYWALTADTSVVDAKVKSGTDKVTRTLTFADSGSKTYKGGSGFLLDTLVVYDEDGAKAVAGVDYVATYEDELLTIERMADGALSTSGSINIEIECENAGVVNIYPICEGGEIPGEDTLQKVLDACSADEVRPLTDKVVVLPPSVEEYDIDLTYYTTAAEEGACIQTIEGDGGAVDLFNEWQSAKLGRDINPDKLRALILAPSGEGKVGATRVVINSPAFTELNDITIARFSGNKNIRHEVAEE